LIAHRFAPVEPTSPSARAALKHHEHRLEEFDPELEQDTRERLIRVREPEARLGPPVQDRLAALPPLSVAFTVATF
jgi:hypothetical protein